MFGAHATIFFLSLLHFFRNGWLTNELQQKEAAESRKLFTHSFVLIKLNALAALMLTTTGTRQAKVQW